MASARPQFYPNTLQPLSIDKSTLQDTLNDLRAAIRRGVDLINSSYPPPVPSDSARFGAIFDGNLGVALMFLMLGHQAPYIMDSSPPLDFQSLAKARIPVHAPKLSLQPGRPSPLCSPSLGASVLRIMVAGGTSRSNSSHTGNVVSKEDISAVREAAEIAIHQDHVIMRNGHARGGDEVLYGRAGLLGSLLDLRRHVVDDETKRALQPIFDDIPKLLDAILESGIEGAEEYAKVNGDTDAAPLMWPWIDEYCSVGAMHGMAGILTILVHSLQSTPKPNPTYTTLLVTTITRLCALCISHHGQLPHSIPSNFSKRASNTPLVQLCHGAPGMLLLLSAALNNPTTALHSTPEWHHALRLASSTVWEQGLLSKGGSVCHGIAGNAWPWLLLHISFQYMSRPGESEEEDKDLSGDHFLSLALSFLLHARETQPFAILPDQGEAKYRTPDAPYSLFEGLAGTICAWAEACVVIVARLRKMELEEQRSVGGVTAVESGETLKQHLQHILGMPGFGSTTLSPSQ